MAKKQLKPIVHREREKNLGLVKTKKKFSPASFRLSITDHQELAKIANEMNSYTNQKNISKTDAIKALIKYGSTLNKSILIKALGDMMY